MIEQGLLGINDGDSIGLCMESGCRYLAAIEYPDVLAVGLRIARLGNGSVTGEVGPVRASDDLSVAKGRFVHRFVDAQTRRPRPLSDRQRTGHGGSAGGRGRCNGPVTAIRHGGARATTTRGT